jgi:hypothetical protein
MDDVEEVLECGFVGVLCCVLVGVMVDEMSINIALFMHPLEAASEFCVEVSGVTVSSSSRSIKLTSLVSIRSMGDFFPLFSGEMYWIFSIMGGVSLRVG